MSIKSLGLTDEQLALWKKVLTDGAKTSLESLGLAAKPVGFGSYLNCQFGGRQRYWMLGFGGEAIVDEDIVHREIWNWMLGIVTEAAEASEKEREEER